MKHPKKSKNRKLKEAKPKGGKPSLAAAWALDFLNSLVLLRALFQDEVGEAFTRLLKWLAKEGEVDALKGLGRYGRLWKAVTESQEFIRHPRVGNSLQDHWLERFLDDPNALHRKADLAPGQIGPALSEAYLQELEHFQKILKTDWREEVQKRTTVMDKTEVPNWDVAGQGSGHFPLFVEARKGLKEKVLSGKPKAYALVDEIAQHFYKNGWGLFGHYRAFRWAASPEGGQLEGVEFNDPIRLENLVGYDEQRKPLIENIEAFVAGKGANNALLYGERGTGKSSTVKALLNAYREKGLRLVEVAAADLKDFHRVLKLLRGRPEKFILFVDDLSFEETETSYKGLKALLEGDVEATPANVILIATSNRRHLIREFFDDRTGGLQKDGEIHGADTVEEKLSLSDRFGLVISFYSPDQDTYLKMVDNWAKVEKIKMSAEELHRRALQWEKANNVRSGRTARQFINDLKGKV